MAISSRQVLDIVTFTAESQTKEGRPQPHAYASSQCSFCRLYAVKATMFPKMANRKIW